jgi:hypothetical protein
MELLASLFVGKPLNILALAVLFFRWISRTAVHGARNFPTSTLYANRFRRLGTLCSMGVAGSDQDS